MDNTFLLNVFVVETKYPRYEKRPVRSAIAPPHRVSIIEQLRSAGNSEHDSVLNSRNFCLARCYRHKSYSSSYGYGNSQFLLLDITTNITKNRKLNDLFHSLWDYLSEEKDEMKEQ
ncbi:hypothetical protein DPMN_021856 [Dreissena polymorpha]|uniref:Uncharacterized protein n=1 Tax=Dreissena polymorpha TaxID=45954 RepID=A0A9D4NJA3_DREPO|nr:hypothetical protein DPMN_021856 [Dreissena polymorpha]